MLGRPWIIASFATVIAAYWWITYYRKRERFALVTAIVVSMVALGFAIAMVH